MNNGRCAHYHDNDGVSVGNGGRASRLVVDKLAKGRIKTVNAL